MDFNELPLAPVPARHGATVGRDNNFNLLRFGLAVLVILAHSPELIDGDRHREILTRLFGTLSFGEVAVDGFFLLSGFLILQSWQRSPSLPGYLLKRVTRIYPGFLMASLVCAVVVGPLGADPGRYFAGMNWPKFVQEALKLQMPLVPPVFQGTPHPYVNGAMWTISCEFRCYMLVGLLGVCGLAGRRAVWLALALVALGGTLVLGPPKQATTQGLVRLLIGQPEELVRLAAYFAAGACFFLGRDQIPLKASWAAVAGLLLVPCLCHPKTAEVGLIVLGAYLLFWFAFAPTPRLARFRSCPDISYGVYLYAWPAQMLLLWYIPGISPWTMFAIALAIACGCGWLSWTFVERPCLRWKWRQGRLDRIAQASSTAPTPGTA